jgi:hypothetical protein
MAKKFVKKSKLTPSWIFNEIMKTGRKQILVASDSELMSFFNIVKSGNLLMPDGQTALSWIKGYFKEQIELLTGQTGKRNEWICERSKYIISLIDEFEVKNG